MVPAELSPRLEEPLRRHFAGDASTRVMIERRGGDRRSGRERRQSDLGPPDGSEERRKIHNAGGRRVGERRAQLLPIDDGPELPRRARSQAERISFVERIEPNPEWIEDLDTARLAIRFQAGDRDAFASIYRRYFDRVYGYLRVTLRDSHEAEDAAQQVFLQVFEALPRYERRSQPFRAWLFVSARNFAIHHLRKLSRVEAAAPEELDRRRELSVDDGESVAALEWIGDQDLLLLIERLPLAQRQALTLKYMLGLSSEEIAAVLDRSPGSVRMLQSRAVAFLRERLIALGRGPRHGQRARMWRWPRQARVLRARRFSLSGTGPYR